MIAREGTSRLIYTHVLAPPQHEDIYADYEYLKPVGDYLIWHIHRFNFKEWLEKYDDRDSTCAFQMEGQMFIIGGNPGSDTERDNFIITDSLDFARQPDLPIGFSFGRCASYSNSQAMICSPSNRQRECYHTSDGQTYTKAGYLTFNHYYGELVRYSDTIFMIGGQSWKYETPGTIFFEDFNANLNDPQVRFQNEVCLLPPRPIKAKHFQTHPSGQSNKALIWIIRCYRVLLVLEDLVQSMFHIKTLLVMKQL